jgi:hypothetical protein
VLTVLTAPAAAGAGQITPIDSDRVGQSREHFPGSIPVSVKAVSTAAARRRGIKLSLKARKARVRAVQSRADARAADLAPIVRELQSAGVTSLVGIAAAFNERSIPTATGQGNWHAVQVWRGLASKLRAPALCRASRQRGRGYE